MASIQDKYIYISFGEHPPAATTSLNPIPENSEYDDLVSYSFDFLYLLPKCIGN
ncbi:hypothetical protein [Dendronalium sp. ChiSLP03b]|uniref:hypothetical protein n=1 Tax=Dendronalium sp. ChiSLP03b TaxID=3075381 RepID=UPI002ADB7A8D|nr:hypothetical protein [Dendronalium sp. ChiSLP03b]